MPLTNREAARELKFMSSSRRRISKEPLYDVFRKSKTRNVDGALPAFFDFSDCIIEYVILDDWWLHHNTLTDSNRH